MLLVTEPDPSEIKKTWHFNFYQKVEGIFWQFITIPIAFIIISYYLMSNHIFSQTGLFVFKWSFYDISTNKISETTKILYFPPGMVQTAYFVHHRVKEKGLAIFMSMIKLSHIKYYVCHCYEWLLGIVFTLIHFVSTCNSVKVSVEALDFYWLLQSLKVNFSKWMPETSTPLAQAFNAFFW